MITKTKTYKCNQCSWTVTLEWVKGALPTATLQSKGLFELSRKAPNRGDGHICKTCGSEAVTG